jgi:hypothetical protein
MLVFPDPEDVAYYVGVARNLVGGRGLVIDAIWSYATPPLTFPRPAFELWLPLPTILASAPMALFGPTFRAAQASSIVLAGVVAVLAWALGSMAAEERGLTGGRARAIALGTGLTSAVYLPLVLASAEPDSTLPFAALALGACLLMGRLIRPEAPVPATWSLVALGILVGLAALARNEAAWLAPTWVFFAWGINRARPGTLARLLGIPAIVALALYGPWLIRDWLVFGSPLPGQVAANAFALRREDIFAWADPPTLERYLDAGWARLLDLRWAAFVHDLGAVLLVLGAPVSAIGLISLPAASRRGVTLRPLIVFALITFTVTTLVFPVATTWGTFLHAAGAVHVLLILSALLAGDSVLAAVSRRRGWGRSPAWMAPAFTIATSIVFTVAVLPVVAASGKATLDSYTALPAALQVAGAPLPEDGTPVITNHAIWLAETTGTPAISLPLESPSSTLDLARAFKARLVVVRLDGETDWSTMLSTGQGAECFRRVPLTLPPSPTGTQSELIAFQIECP